jgi:hypothetical protein
MPLLPGRPDRPPVRVTKRQKMKPKLPKVTKNNRYTSAPPKRRPATVPGSVGSGTAAPRGPIPIDPYARYREKYPWAWAQLTDIDRAQASHQQYAGQVGDWLSKGLQGLTGIDPNQPGYNPAVQQQYMANVAGQVGGALNAAAVATPAQVAAPGMGGVVQGNNAFMGQAAREANAQRSSAAIQMSQAQSALNTMQPNTFAQGAMRAYADMQAGLPALYASRRTEARGKIDQFILEFEEEKRQARVQEAISAQNAQTNAALSFAQLGLKADDQAFDQTQDLSESAADQAAAGAPAPYGYQRDPATGKLVRDPSVPQASASGSTPKAPKGTYNVNELRKQGFVGGWKVKPKKAPQGAKGTFVKAANGTWWIKAGTGSGTGGTGKPNVGKPAQDVYTALVKANDDSLISVDQNEGTGDLLRFLRKYQPDKQNFPRWYGEIVETLKRVDPDYAEWIVGWVMRRKKDKTWKGTF